METKWAGYECAWNGLESALRNCPSAEGYWRKAIRWWAHRLVRA